MIPIPPSLAMAMARRASVTVSIAAETKGMFSEISRGSWVRSLVSRGSPAEQAGANSTSSQVYAFWTRRIEQPHLPHKPFIVIQRASERDRQARGIGAAGVYCQIQAWGQAGKTL